MIYPNSEQVKSGMWNSIGRLAEKQAIERSVKTARLAGEFYEHLRRELGCGELEMRASQTLPGYLYAWRLKCGSNWFSVQLALPHKELMQCGSLIGMAIKRAADFKAKARGNVPHQPASDIQRLPESELS